MQEEQPRQRSADEADFWAGRNEGDDVEGHFHAARSGEAPGDDENPGFHVARRPDAGDEVEGHVMTPPDNRSGESEPGAEEGGEGFAAF